MLKSIHTRHNHVFLDMLRSSREAQRLRQSDLAIRLGRDQATISKVERY
jgi:transcriptional regulator with XRE-family HTH domain